MFKDTFTRKQQKNSPAEKQDSEKQNVGYPSTKGSKMNSFYFGLNETELRDICRHNIDTFENWSRRLIDEQLKSNYGDDYFDYSFAQDQPLIKSEIRRQVEARMNENPERFPRRIDALVIENIIYFFCREDLYSAIFKPILGRFFSGVAEVRSVMERIVSIRNKLSHGNTISFHEAEQCICYTNDFIETFKAYYQDMGKSKEYNVPVFTRIKDSLGHDIIRQEARYSWELYLKGGALRPKVQLRSGDEYKIWVEVDNSFDINTYSITWYAVYGMTNLIQKGSGTEIVLHPSNKMVSYSPEIVVELTTNKEWHRFANIGCDDRIEIHLDDILPPIEDTY